MENKTKILFAVSSGHSLLRKSAVPKIGEVHFYNTILPSGKLSPCKLIIFDWFESGNQDFFIFNDEGLISNVIHPETPKHMTKEYRKILAESPFESDFLEKIIGYFVFHELGF